MVNAELRKQLLLGHSPFLLDTELGDHSWWSCIKRLRIADNPKPSVFGSDDR